MVQRWDSPPTELTRRFHTSPTQHDESSKKSSHEPAHRQQVEVLESSSPVSTPNCNPLMSLRPAPSTRQVRLTEGPAHCYPSAFQPITSAGKSLHTQAPGENRCTDSCIAPGPDCN